MSARRNSLLRSTSGAVAPTVALSLFGLIAAGGIAFDYARMAGLDTELQTAADQAALAAATQLDGKANAVSRATSAAQNMILNKTRFANDGNASGMSITVPTLTFYESYNSSTDVPGTVTTDDTKAKFVQVAVGSREAVYALTPIVRAFRSGNLGAQAVAGMGSAICKVPPVMICNPAETGGGAFPTAADNGKGLLLEAGGGTTWTPGNYGYLDFGSGASSLEQALGANSDIENCLSSDSIATKPGNTASVPDAINTRFDIYGNGLTNYCSASTGNCSPALNVRKDVIHVPFSTGTGNGNGNGGSNGNAGGNGNGNGNGGSNGGGGGGGPNCGFANGTDPWVLPSVQYLPSASTRAQVGSSPDNMGFPRDICHAVSSTGDCTSYNGGQAARFGDGNWARDLYFQVNHPGSLSAAQAWTGRTNSTRLTRYDVYRWELATAGMLDSRSIASGSYYSYGSPQCAAGVGESTTQKDRRVITAAVVDCVAGGVKGSTAIKVKSWIDLFLVEPSLARTRTSADQIYVEIIGPATKPGGGNAFQYYSRNKPYLIK